MRRSNTLLLDDNNLPGGAQMGASLPGNVVVVTRMINANTGNQALSSGLIEFLSSGAGVASLRVLNRYPRRFESLNLDQFAQSQLLEAFDHHARGLISEQRPSANGHLAPEAGAFPVLLDRTGFEMPAALKSVKRAIGLRRNLAKLGIIGRDQIEQALNTCAWADLLILNPAGELHPTGSVDEVMRLMLLVRVAQLLGTRTAIINHSLEIADQRLQAVVAHVYRHADLIAVREALSYNAALSLGVAAERLIEAPDLVFLLAHPARSNIGAPEPIPTGAIGLAFNRQAAARGVDEWDELLIGLSKFGRPLVFVSNAMNHDHVFAQRLARRHPVQVISRQPSYEELIKLFGEMSLLVSSRLHATILALGAGTPVATIEPEGFKLTGVMERLNYPLPTKNTRAPGWSKAVVANVRKGLEDRETLVAVGNAALDHERRAIVQAYRAVFELATKAPQAAVS